MLVILTKKKRLTAAAKMKTTCVTILICKTTSLLLMKLFFTYNMSQHEGKVKSKRKSRKIAQVKASVNSDNHENKIKVANVILEQKKTWYLLQENH